MNWFFSATQEMLLNFPIYMMRMLLQAPHTCFDVDDGGDDNLMMMLMMTLTILSMVMTMFLPAGYTYSPI